MVVQVCVFSLVPVLRRLALESTLSLILVPLLALPENQKRAAVGEALCWQASEKEPLQPGGAAAAAVEQMWTWLKCADGFFSDGLAAEPQWRVPVQAEPRSRSPPPPQSRHRRLTRRRSLWIPPLPPGRHSQQPEELCPEEAEKKLRPEEAAGQKPWVEGALDCLCAGGVDQPRVLVELRELYEKDSLAAWRAVAQFRRQVAASIDKPNNYARSLISKERRQAGLWVIR